MLLILVSKEGRLCRWWSLC